VSKQRLRMFRASGADGFGRLEEIDLRPINERRSQLVGAADGKLHLVNCDNTCRVGRGLF
jgi:hypothetical protein